MASSSFQSWKISLQMPNFIGGTFFNHAPNGKAEACSSFFPE
jgi:hypothetical protein